LTNLCRKIADRRLPIEEYQNFFLSLVNESERGLAIISFAYIDTMMQSLMLAEFNPQVSGGAESLLSPQGPLDTASARSKMCAALNWITQDTYRDLDLLRKIRNEFAHNPLATSFEDTKIKGLLSSMTTREQAMIAALPERNFVLTPRQVFHGRSAVTCAHMMRQLIGAPAALRMGLPADFGYAVGWEREPLVVRELMRAVSAVCLKVALRPRDAAADETRAAASGEAR
jgi:DNA-binding MltR family transcriptional regulator